MRILDLYWWVYEKKGEMSWWRQVDEILEMGTLWNEMFFQGCKYMKSCICIIVKMMLPHDCYALLEKENHCNSSYLVGDYSAPMLQ